MSKAPAKGQKTQALFALHWIPNLTPAARRVGAWLVWHANASTGRCDPGQARLRDETGLSRRTIQYAVQELIGCSIVNRTLRGTDSSSYALNWDGLSHLTAQYEQLAKNREKLPQIKNVKTNRGRKKLHHPAQKSAPQVAQEAAPKPTELNPRKEPMFRAGTISDKSEDGAYLHPQDINQTDAGEERVQWALEREQASKSEFRSDDDIAVRILNTRADHGFVAYLDREARKGRRFRPDIADAMCDRLEAICGGSPGFEETGVTGRAYRLLTDFEFYGDEDEVA